MTDALIDRWWKPKATNLLAVLYAVALATALDPGLALQLFVPALVTIAGIGTLGHLINDWYDVEPDAAVGKPNRIAGLPPAARRGIFTAAAAAAVLPWLVLPSDAVSVTLLAAEFVLLFAYAAPPVRLKIRRVWPVVADAAYAYSIPAALAAHTFFLASEAPDDRAFLLALCVWQQALGMRHFLNHLALDRRNDLATRTPTLATERGNRFVRELIRRGVLPFELAGFTIAIIVLGRYRPALPIVFAGLLLASFAIRQIASGRRFFVGPYRFSETAIDRLYQQLLPAILLIFLVVRDWRFVFLLVVHAALFSARGAAVAACLLRAPSSSARPPEVGGRAVAQRQMDPLDVLNVGAVDVTGIGVAVVNFNKQKYTETFVHGPIRKMRCRIHYLYGGELPRFDETDRGFLPWRPSLQLITSLVQRWLRLDSDFFLKDSVARYLQTKDVRLVLAHFGPVGARVAPIAGDTGIPIIVWFHGYDAFNRELMREWTPRYARLFQEADRILAVSRRMMSHLQELGAPAHKLVHLPAFVDLESFPFTDHSGIGPRFLAVGRFAETKSPHLTILAFHRVVKRVPEARLIMVGKGGGGELFEACVILVQALGLTERVEFKREISHAEVAAEMKQARVFVQHSVTTPEQSDMEGKPVAIMEAMACGLPVVATRHSGIVELIEHGASGLLVEELDVDGMADAMLALAANDRLVSEIGANASRRIHDDPLIRDHVAILERIIGESLARNERRSERAVGEPRRQSSVQTRYEAVQSSAALHRRGTSGRLRRVP
jgi:colanic acid/amylovoran biosynthesis glycosyltransferase